MPISAGVVISSLSESIVKRVPFHFKHHEVKHFSGEEGDSPALFDVELLLFSQEGGYLFEIGEIFLFVLFLERGSA